MVWIACDEFGGTVMPGVADAPECERSCSYSAIQRLSRLIAQVT
jgi:hypothetical protein